MATIYHADFKYINQGGKEELSLVHILPDGSRDECYVNLDEIRQIEKRCKDFNWNQSLKVLLTLRSFHYIYILL